MHVLHLSIQLTALVDLLLDGQASRLQGLQGLAVPPMQVPQQQMGMPHGCFFDFGEFGLQEKDSDAAALEVAGDSEGLSLLGQFYYDVAVLAIEAFLQEAKEFAVPVQLLVEAACADCREKDCFVGVEVQVEDAMVVLDVDGGAENLGADGDWGLCGGLGAHEEALMTVVRMPLHGFW